MPGHIVMLENMGYKLTLNDDETVATVRTPGLSIETYDRNGNPKITSLMHLLMAARFYGCYKPLDESGHTFCDYAKLTENCLVFMASVEMEIDEAMYDPSISKWPCDFTFQLGYVGKSSMNSVGNLIIPSTGKVLLRNVIQLVSVDVATRRPLPLPDWWRERYAGSAVRNGPLIVKRIDRPTETSVTQVTVRWTDTDCYNHTNWASYVRFSIDAMHEGIRRNFYKNITKECVIKGLRKIRMGFVGENPEGEALTIHTWESSDHPLTVCCEIENNGIRVFHTTLYYTDHVK